MRPPLEAALASATTARASTLIGALTCALLLSCGNRSIELSTPPRLEPSTEPTALASINEHVAWLAVDDQRLYWTGIFADSNFPEGETGAALHSCDKTRCAESLVTYDSSQVDINVAFGVHDGAIYWSRLSSVDGSSYEIASCETAGCYGPPGVLYTSNVGDFGPLCYGSDGIYFSAWSGANFGIQRLSYAGGDPQFVAQAVGYPQGLVVNGDYLYTLDFPPDPGVTLRRARTDGSTQFETVGEQLRIVTGPAPQSSSLYTNLAFDESYVYWTSNALSGAIQRCPLIGCGGTPETLTAPIRAPTALRLDGAKAYFQYEDAVLGNSLTSCTLPQCEPSAPIASGLDDWNVIALDDRYIYTATTGQVTSPDVFWPFPSAMIRRFPK